VSLAPTSDLTLPATPEWRGTLARLAPLWRHAVFVASLFVLLAAWVEIRVEVQQLRKDLDRSGRTHRESRVLNDRLRLELDARRRAVALEADAARLSVGQSATVVRVAAPATRAER
jgi:hypothetical protein